MTYGCSVSKSAGISVEGEVCVLSDADECEVDGALSKRTPNRVRGFGKRILSPSNRCNGPPDFVNDRRAVSDRDAGPVID